MRRGEYRNYSKGLKDKIKVERRSEGGRWEWLGWGGVMGRKCRQLYLNNNQKRENKDLKTYLTPYDLTFNWNIINKRRKQTKYNQRH